MQRLAEHAIDAALALGAGYADVRLIEQEHQTIETKDLTVSMVNIGESRGAGIRVLCNGGWGFAATQKMTTAGMDLAAGLAVRTARASASCLRDPVTLAPEPVYNTVWVSPYTKDPFAVSLERKIAILLKAAAIMKTVNGVTLAQGEMSFIREKKYFANSDGSRIDQMFIRSGCGIIAHATGENDRQTRSYPNSFGGQHELAGWEMVERLDLPGNALRIAEESVALLSADPCPQGRRDIIIGSSQLGLQIHESCGHPSELDRALGQEINMAGASFLTPDNLGKLQYGSSIVNLVADATARGALGSFGFDDEGVQARKVYLVRNGLFSGYLSSRDTANLIGLSRSGGAMRAESWHYAPIIRMTNISLEPGTAGTLEDLIEDTEDGILFETNKSWSIDNMRYNFQFSTEIAWEVKNGKRTRMLKNASYGGITPDFWRACDAICGASDYVEWGLPNCGKGQPMQTMWTGHGAAPARFRSIDVGMAHAIH